MSIARKNALGLILLLAALAGCGKASQPQAALCEQVSRILFSAGRIERLESAADPGSAHGIATEIALRGADGTLERHRVECSFAGGPFSSGQLDLVQVASDVEGRLSVAHMAALGFVLDRFGASSGAAARAPLSRPALRLPLGVETLYFLQQVVNGVTLGCVVSLIAVGYTLIYGIIGVINLSFGEIYMIGAVVAIIGALMFMMLGVASETASVLLALPFAMALAAGYSMMTDRLVFRPLREASTLMPLIASIGLAIVLQNYVFLVESPRNLWLPARPQDGIELAVSGNFSLYVNRQQALVLALTALLAGATWILLTRTRFGRVQRACSSDRRMAALLGVDVDRVVAVTFGLGGALAAAGGLMVGSYYGGVNFAMGLAMGLKALTAAIVGGIGNFKGALLGGFVVALLETFWAGYLPGAYRELSVFALLIVLLIFRPQGILGEV